MQNFDEQAEKYLGAVEKQKESEGKAVDKLLKRNNIDKEIKA